MKEGYQGAGKIASVGGPVLHGNHAFLARSDLLLFPGTIRSMYFQSRGLSIRGSISQLLPVGRPARTVGHGAGLAGYERYFCSPIGIVDPDGLAGARRLDTDRNPLPF